MQKDKKVKSQEERIQEIEKELEKEFEEENEDDFFEDDDDDENENTIENFRLHKSLIIAETKEAVLVKIGKGAFWLNKKFIIASKYSLYNQIGIIHEFDYICEINDTKKQIKGSKLIKIINEYKDRKRK